MRVVIRAMTIEPGARTCVASVQSGLGPGLYYTAGVPFQTRETVDVSCPKATRVFVKAAWGRGHNQTRRSRTMSALSFSAAVAARPALVGTKARATSKVNKETRALGGFGPNMPADEYRKKMEAKKKLIEDNKKKAAAKKSGGKPAAKGAKGAKTEKKGFFGFGK